MTCSQRHRLHHLGCAIFTLVFLIYGVGSRPTELVAVASQIHPQQRRVFEGASIILPSAKLRFSRALRLHSLFYETNRGRIFPTKQQFGTSTAGVTGRGWTSRVQMPDGRTINASITRERQTITVPAASHQLQLFIRVGAKVELGDLNREWKESLEIAGKKPDLRKLDADLKAWFQRQR